MKLPFFAMLLCAVSCNTDTAKSVLYNDTEYVPDRAAYTLSGKIVWAGDTSVGVGSTVVWLTGAENQSVVTTASGLYSFVVSTTGNYQITPTKTINLLNGVTTLDATIVQQYVAGVISLPTFNVIASDANKNNVISTADASIINQSVLGNPVAQNILKPSWTFVDRVYVFGTVPPIPNYPKTISINVTGDATQLDFVGIKRGDVDFSANPNL